MIRRLWTRAMWIALRRRALSRDVAGFYAGPRTFADSASRFGAYAALHGDANLHRVTLGRFSYVAGGIVTNTTVGSFSCIGPDVVVGGLGRHPTRWISSHPAFYSLRAQTSLFFADRDYYDEYLPVTIGHDVWVGARALILDGVTIGDGAIVAAASVVSRPVQPYEIVAGVPARVIRRRFPDEGIAALARLRWWDADVELLRRATPLFRSEDWKAFVGGFETLQAAWLVERGSGKAVPPRAARPEGAVE